MIRLLDGGADVFALIEVQVTANVPLSVGSRNIANVFHYVRLGGSGAPDLNGFLSNFVNTVRNGGSGGLDTVLSADDTITFTCKARYPLDPTNAPSGNATFSTAAGVAGDRLPLDQCVNVRMTSGVRGREYRGNKKFGPVAEADTLKDELDTTPYANWQAATNFLLSIITDGGSSSFGCCVLSRKLSNLLIVPTSAIVADVTGVVVNRRVCRIGHRRQRRD